MQTRPTITAGKGERNQQLTGTNKIQPDIPQTNIFSIIDLNQQILRISKFNTVFIPIYIRITDINSDNIVHLKMLNSFIVKENVCLLNNI